MPQCLQPQQGWSGIVLSAGELGDWGCVLDCVVPDRVLIVDPEASVIGEVAEGGGADEVFELSPYHLVDVVTCPFIGVDLDGVSGCHPVLHIQR